MSRASGSDRDRAEALEQARRRMLEHDLRARDIRDPRVLDAMAAVPRERFIDEDTSGRAYADRPLPIGEGQTISQPYIVALMAQELRLGPEDRLLDVGTGSGYAAAVMAQLVDQVISIERHRSLASAAIRRLRDLGIDNVEVVIGDGSHGWPAGAPYDAIGVAASARRIPNALVEQLADGGRLVLPVGPASGVQELLRVTREGDQLHQEVICEVRFVPLISEGPDRI